MSAALGTIAYPPLAPTSPSALGTNYGQTTAQGQPPAAATPATQLPLDPGHPPGGGQAVGGAGAQAGEPEGNYRGASPGRASPLGVDAPVKTTWTAKTSYPNADNPTYHELHPEGAEAFHSAIGAAKHAHEAGAAVTQYPAEDYKDMRTFLTKERDAGFALKGDDIVSVFKHPKAPYRNVTRSMLDLAKQNGGRRLDAFDTVLPHLYAQNGFRAVARLPWNEEYKPEGWKHDTFKAHNGGRPDVVFMAHDPQAGAYQPWDGKRIADYDEGEHHQRAALAQVQARGNMPAAPGPEAYGSGQLIRHSAPLQVFHGTPHEFRGTRANPLGEFDISKLGTGEGAQAYGHGPYVAGNEKVAQGYRDDLSGGVKYQGGSIPRSMSDPHALAVHQVAEYMQDQGLTAQQAIQKVSAEYKDAHASASMWDAGSASAKEANRRRAQLHLGTHMAAEKLKPEHFTNDQGHLYEAELHVHPDHMLDWDKPLHQHSQYVQERLRPHVERAMELGHMTGMHPLTASGEEVHSAMQSLSPEFEAGGSGRAGAAKSLLEAGIPGIKYADAGSRQHVHALTQGEAKLAEMRAQGADAFRLSKQQEYVDHLRSQVSHNYVVFDPRTLNIVKRNGLPAMVDAGADALAEHKRGTS
jgi:hypothetical protein